MSNIGPEKALHKKTRIGAITRIIVEPLKFSYEHDKVVWIGVSIGYALIPFLLIWAIYETITDGFEWQLIPTVLFGWCMALVFIGMLLNSIKRDLEKQLIREHPCPRCKGKGYAAKKGE